MGKNLQAGICIMCKTELTYYGNEYCNMCLSSTEYSTLSKESMKDAMDPRINEEE